ncbi:hypothetical protein BCR33DRAFT_722176 [Rhizoclosmatium globosum]|uniref:DUF1365-domain-containing protein n=1 Tax=Rhizoclosmatium globosum TaxID=329046 RepID=A0A1Y2BNN4_9FUNG|nr:hypothetical protein BCR33DRAFT_722176 [Rhizoclosmatium globosum]|eukprot:ORY36371.1 hypothetical protein BCR33DRAFT_722176 [Rhizoclosmatium globosum]
MSALVPLPLSVLVPLVGLVGVVATIPLFASHLFKVRVASLFAAPSTTATATTSATASARDSCDRLFFAITRHVRLVPRRHAFVFPVVYAGVVLDASTGSNKKNRIARNKWAVLSVHDKDYLDKEDKPIREKVLAAIKAAGTHTPVPIGRIELVTGPRFFGLPTFNPLNVYYCFDEQQDGDSKEPTLRVTILEVNNTFGERHVYICDDRNRLPTTKQGYHSSYVIDRSFFVSPFNNRSGVYETHIARVTENKMGVLLILKDYAADKNELQAVTDDTVVPSLSTQSTTKDSSVPRDTSNLTKHLIASVEGTSVPFSAFTTAVLLYFHPFTVFLTLPRIMSEAWKIAYIKKLTIYQKPNPRRTTTPVGTGKTIVPLPESAFDTYARTYVLDHFVKQCAAHDSALHITLVDKTSITVTSSGVIPFTSTISAPHIHLLSPYLFSRLLIDFTNPSRALSTTFVSGEWSAYTLTDIRDFLRLLTPTQTQLLADKKSSKQIGGGGGGVYTTLACWFHGFYHTSTLTTFPPFSSTSTTATPALIPVTSEETFRRVFWGSLEVWASEWAFRAVTRFVVDPYDVSGRISREYSSVKSSSSSGDINVWEAREGVLVGEMDDCVAVMEREEKRFRILEACL